MKGHVYKSNPVDEAGKVKWSAEDNNTWKILVERQAEIIKGRACQQFSVTPWPPQI